MVTNRCCLLLKAGSADASCAREHTGGFVFHI